MTELISETWQFEIEKIPAELRELEPDLMQTRWFDYRRMTPLEATKLFALLYNIEYRNRAAMMRDLERAAMQRDQLKGLENETSVNLLSAWRSRQAADRIGCRYEFYIRYAFKRTFENLWRYIPRINQLYNEDLATDIATQWELESRVSLQLASDPFFKTDRYVGHPDQLAYHQYLINEARRREHPHMMLARVVYREKMLPAELVVESFGPDVLRRARLLSM